MWAVVPIKGFESPKQRLAETLSPKERGDLAECMLRDVITALEDLEGILVISGDAAALEVAYCLGARVMEEKGNGGYSAAVHQACKILASEGVTGMMHVPGDVPLISRDEVKQIASLQANDPGACVVPSRDFGGTNCLALWPPDLMEPAFGSDSFRRHCEMLRNLGIKPIVLELDGFALDIDTLEDLRLFCMGQKNCSSLQYLQSSGISVRILSD